MFWGADWAPYFWMALAARVLFSGCGLHVGSACWFQTVRDLDQAHIPRGLVSGQGHGVTRQLPTAKPQATHTLIFPLKAICSALPQLHWPGWLGYLQQETP